ncbi:ACP phosphodiesterase [Persicirhabdus sediminis]|uniref:DUF479 domain-containing protein n=1 Tax=Persicirhabdus sediminis TaxID=454144 RepID=A0A8J7MFK6_9BACT|nr:ACP phosphodiesterase [Persicirhabdus sediminis]MBK1792546.1 DUF479 domain-containing protein [Persicirhabdus sediminis]
MNFLAHLLLADQSDAGRIGNFLGDFVRGRIDSLDGQWPAQVIDGIALHRSIDQFTDSHTDFRACRQLLAPERRRFAGIIVDIYFDHFIASNWHRYHTEPLDDFIAQFYQSLLDNPAWLTPMLQQIMPRMIEENWLGSYGSLDDLRLTFERVSWRSPRISIIRHAVDDLEANYQPLQQHFESFYPQLETHVASWKNQAKG